MPGWPTSSPFWTRPIRRVSLRVGFRRTGLRRPRRVGRLGDGRGRRHRGGGGRRCGRARPADRSPSPAAGGVDTVAASTAKGALIHRLIRGGTALFTAHTNADSADPGVSDALAETLGLRVESVLNPLATAAHLDKWVVFVPGEHAGALRAALFAAGAGEIGDYSHFGLA